MIRIFQYGEVPNETLFIRSPLIQDVSGTVKNILADVREHGDEALFRLTEQFDGAKLRSLLVSDEEIEEAFRAVSEEYRAVLRLAHDNIAEYHRQQIRPGFSITRPDGVVLGQKVTPIARVGLYVPNGTAAYPSSLLMNCVPAKLAGCGMLVITTPPGPDGKVDPAILAAAKIAGVDRIYKIGGAQAVAALAYGTESVPKVDKIVGPGNAYVAEAKRQVFGAVAIDTIAGPSEVLIVADGTNDPGVLAADMLAQAEHDVMATSVLVTDSPDLGNAVAALAYGTESVPKVDKIVGPGNAYVAEAKRQVFGAVAIDTTRQARPGGARRLSRGAEPHPPDHRHGEIRQPPLGGRLREKEPVHLLLQRGPPEREGRNHALRGGRRAERAREKCGDTV